MELRAKQTKSSFYGLSKKLKEKETLRRINKNKLEIFSITKMINK